MTTLIAWKEGMALSQQHLQQSDQFLLKHIKNVSGLPKGMHFGFGKLELDEDLIKDGLFAFKECTAVFPSGIFFKSAKIEARKFDKSLDAFLALDLNSSSRYDIAWENYPDLYYEEEYMKMPVSFPKPKIVFSGESLDGKEFLPIARIEKTLQGTFEPDKNFFPPLISMNGSEYFAKKLKYFDALLQNKIENISHSKELLLRDLKSLRAVLGCMQNAEGVLPFNFFCEIAKFLQEPFSYAHGEFNKSFNNIFNALNNFLLQEKKTNILQKRIEKEGQNSFSANLADFELSAASSAWLAVASKLSPEEAVKFMAMQLRIAPKSKLANILISATHGINCIHCIVPKTIQEIPGTYYFKLQTDSQLWKNLCEEKEISIYAPPTLQIDSIDFLTEVL